MATEQNKKKALEIFGLLNQKKLDDVVSLYSADARFYGFAPQTLDKTGYRQSMDALLTAFPDAHFQVEDIIAEGDTVTVRHNFQGTQRKEYQGIPVTGKSALAHAIATIHFKNGQPIDTYLNAEFLAILQQLGAIPTPGQA